MGCWTGLWIPARSGRLGRQLSLVSLHQPRQLLPWVGAIGTIRKHNGKRRSSTSLRSRQLSALEQTADSCRNADTVAASIISHNLGERGWILLSLVHGFCERCHHRPLGAKPNANLVASSMTRTLRCSWSVQTDSSYKLLLCVSYTVEWEQSLPMLLLSEQQRLLLSLTTLRYVCPMRLESSAVSGGNVKIHRSNQRHQTLQLAVCIMARQVPGATNPLFCC